MAKHWIDLDDDALDCAYAELGTRSIDDTVNEALRRATHGREAEIPRALDNLAEADLVERSNAWR